MLLLVIDKCEDKINLKLKPEQQNDSLFIQWKSLNVIILRQTETDNINQMITISN